MIECDATLNALVVYVACPPLMVPVPNVAAPSLKVTVPETVPAPGAVMLTVAVNVTDCPKTDGFCDETTEVVVLALFTVCVKADEFVLGRKLLSPAYSAVIECEATLKAPVKNVAEPPLKVPVPKVVVPSLKVTVPVGVPVAGATAATVAVNVTDCPETLGFTDELTDVLELPFVMLNEDEVALVSAPDVAVSV